MHAHNNFGGNQNQDQPEENFSIEDSREFFHARNKTGVVHNSHLPHIDSEAAAIWSKYSQQDEPTPENLQKSFVRHVIGTLARTHFNMDNFAAYQAMAYSLRDRLITQWNSTQQHHTRLDLKRVYYLSLEFLLGRSLDNVAINMNLKDKYSEALDGLGFRMEDILEEESDAALGNGGLGRLAACFMDSMATMNFPAWGYGLRYTYGIFRQKIVDGHQTEFPDYWLNFGNPWEIPRLDVAYEVRFYGTVVKSTDSNGKTKSSWIPGQTVEAVAYDVPIPGFNTSNTINIRLWGSKPKKQFDLKSFNEGDYQKAVDDQQKAENITSVLYPNDNTMAGKELRLKQQYFFVCATIQDIIRRFKKSARPITEFASKVAIQLNDTHPTLGIVELQRRLVDIEGLDWDCAWNIVRQVYAFTNHTVLPEAMEKWPVEMLTNILPRHMEIIYDINLFFLQKVEAAFPNDRDRLRRMSIIEESPYQQVRMAHLALVGSHTVNGVAAIHSNLLRTTVFKDFVEFYGVEKFQNKTNGITPRRWLYLANPSLSSLMTEYLGSESWTTNLDHLKLLKKFADDPKFQAKWLQVKQTNKVKLAKYIESACSIAVDPNSLFDVQVKRIHEYKRQFMNILGVIHRYLTLKNMEPEELERVVPRTVIFGGKAAPGYHIAKLVIKLINSVACVVNADRQTNHLLKVVFIPDYNVSLAELIVPASDISQHISTAGTEASGTSNMKFVLNGGLILGTLDGANIEIKEEIGDENIFIFGVQAHEVENIRHCNRYRKTVMNPKLEHVLSALHDNMFCDYSIIAPLVNTLTVGCDYYLISADFDSYLTAQAAVDACFVNKKEWLTKSIVSACSMGKFSSDRTICEYAEQIWKLEPCQPSE